MIVPGSESQVLAARVSRKTERELCRVEYDRFPDGEGIVRIDGVVEDEDVAVVASTPTDRSLVQLHQVLDALEKADSVTLVIPYMGYSRQDKRFEDGQPVSARVVARTTSATVARLNEIYTVNLHEEGVLDWFTDVETRDLDASTVLADDLVGDELVLAPDTGAKGLAEKVAGEAGCSWDYLEKTRLSGDEVEVKPKNLSVEDRDAVVVDDMIATGSTMSETLDVLEEQKPASVSLRCIHPVLAKNALTKLYRSGVEEIRATDTIETGLSTLSVADVVAEAIS
ncbi:MAG: ribose-phosphate diphosphokinase [Halobacteria archaeon]